MFIYFSCRLVCTMVDHTNYSTQIFLIRALKEALRPATLPLHDVAKKSLSTGWTSLALVGDEQMYVNSFLLLFCNQILTVSFHSIHPMPSRSIPSHAYHPIQSNTIQCHHISFLVVLKSCHSWMHEHTIANNRQCITSFWML